MNDLVSVIIPVYNVEKYIAECLDSILNQTFESYEIICVDDCSTDNSMAIVEEYANTNDKIKIARHAYNRGLSAARNTGLEYAKGTYVCFLDSDDMVKADMLEVLYQEAKNRNLEIIYFGYEKFWKTEDNEEKYLSIDKHDYYNCVFKGLDLFRVLTEKNMIREEACRQFIKKEFLVLNNLKFYEGILHEDSLFYFLCIVKAKRVMEYDKSLYLYRQRSGSIMSTLNYKRVQSLYIVIMELLKCWNNNEFSDKENEAIGSYIKRIYISYCTKLKYFKEYEPLQIGTYADKFLFELINTPIASYITLSGEQIEQIKDREKIIVFGAGRGAINIIEQLKRENISIFAVAVSNMNANPEYVCGIKVHVIGEFLSDKERATIIVSTTKKYSQSIRQQLREMGFNRIIISLDCR